MQKKHGAGSGNILKNVMKRSSGSADTRAIRSALVTSLADILACV